MSRPTPEDWRDEQLAAIRELLERQVALLEELVEPVRVAAKEAKVLQEIAEAFGGAFLKERK